MTEQLHFHVSLSCIGEGNDNPLQCSCPENPGDGGAWWAAVYGVAQSWTWLNDLAIAILTNEGWYFIIVLICIYLIISNVEHLFMCLLATYMSSLGKCLFRSSAPFLFGFFFFFDTELHELFVYLRLIPCWLLHMQTFLPFYGFPFHFVYGFFCYAKLLCLIRSHLLIFVSIFISLGGGSKDYCWGLCLRTFCQWFPLRVL